MCFEGLNWNLKILIVVTTSTFENDFRKNIYFKTFSSYCTFTTLPYSYIRSQLSKKLDHFFFQTNREMNLLSSSLFSVKYQVPYYNQIWSRLVQLYWFQWGARIIE